MCIWVGAGSVASWAVEIVGSRSKQIIGDDGQPLPVVAVVYSPPVNPAKYIRSFEFGDAVPENAESSGTSLFFTNEGVLNGKLVRYYYMIFDPSKDRLYCLTRVSESFYVVQNFLESSTYRVLRWPYTTRSVVDPDLEGVQEKMTGGMLPMLLLLLGCGIGLKLLDYGSIKLMRFWDDKDSQRALARINNIDDPLEHKVALEAHRKAYNARFKRYAKEDRQRRRR